MADPIAVNWVTLAGYSISQQLKHEGISFDAFDIIERSIAGGAKKVRQKIVAGLAKDLRAECLEQELGDIQKVQHGCYCISLSGGFSLDYAGGSSPVLYIGSGAVYSRMKSHLSGKLFDFAEALQSIPLAFSFCDLDDLDNATSLQRELEQSLLSKFATTIDPSLPLLNAKNAKSGASSTRFVTGWDKPLQKKKGKSTLEWLIKPSDSANWKGALQ
ncbi:MAG: hypothetical protein NTW20_02895 [Rhodobacterales bacterium]|nr:hypothetical protein [Rhodobacterales bacterium]